MNTAQNKNKLWYAEQVRNSLADGLVNRDIKIDFREIFLQLDNLVNEYAKLNFFENWKFGTGTVDDAWIVDFSPIQVTDQLNANSFFTLPSSNYVTLPKGQGLNAVYFTNTNGLKKRYFKPVVIKQFNDVASYRSSMAGDNQGRISCYVKNRIVYFDRGKIDQMYGTVGVRLVLRDASMLSDTDVYPVPAEYENVIISRCVDFFMARRLKTADLIRDNNDTEPPKPTRVTQ